MNIMLKETSESVGLLRRKRIKTSSIHKIPNKVLKQLIQKENLREESISSIENNVSLPQKEESLDLIGNITYLLNTKEEKIILLSNDVSFTLYGKGNFKIYFGCLKILEVSSIPLMKQTLLTSSISLKSIHYFQWKQIKILKNTI